MALTAGEITELTNLLIKDYNSVSEDGLVVQVEKTSGGDTQKRKAGRVRALLAKLAI